MLINICELHKKSQAFLEIQLIYSYCDFAFVTSSEKESQWNIDWVINSLIDWKISTLL